MSLSDKDFLVKSTVLGPLQTNSYLIAHLPTREAVLIDGGAIPLQLLKFVRLHELNMKYALLTHCHFDHIQGIEEVRQMTGCKVAMHKAEDPILQAAHPAAAQWGFEPPKFQEPDLFIADGEKISVGNLALTALWTPGHSPGGLSFYAAELGVVFSGDCLFMQSIGRTDFPRGDFKTLITSIRTRLFTLPEETRVAPGHGPSTTISHEKRSNPFL
ncbi:MAG: MBL fold metallo-hydrolase [Candidatus Heimdallarchaeota archaeon]